MAALKPITAAALLAMLAFPAYADVTGPACVTYFDKERDDDPAVSGSALALVTKKADEGGRASAFSREIRFFH